jgi:hypothetical protein
MKTTIELLDTLYRQIKARAALRGQAINAFILDAIREKLAGEDATPKGDTGLRAAFGKANKDEVAEVQRIIDEEFSHIDPEDW